MKNMKRLLILTMLIGVVFGAGWRNVYSGTSFEASEIDSYFRFVVWDETNQDGGYLEYQYIVQAMDTSLAIDSIEARLVTDRDSILILETNKYESGDSPVFGEVTADSLDIEYATIDTLVSDTAYVTEFEADNIYTTGLDITDALVGILTVDLHNTSAASAAVVGALYTVTNDNGYWGGMGMTSSGSTIGAGAFVNTYHLYNQGYANTLFTVDGNKDFVWYSDPTDAHNFTALTNDVMTLEADGDLLTKRIYPERVIPDSIWHAYGGFEDSATVIAIATQNLWYHITDEHGDLFGGLEADGLMLYGDTMVIDNSGDYTGIASLTYTGLNGKDFQCRLYNVTQARQEGFHIGRSTSGAANFGNLSLPLYVEAMAGDSLVLQVRNITDNADPTFRSGMFWLSFLHE